MKKYSSLNVKSLIENQVYRFWKKDWSKSILVNWPKNVKKDKFFEEIRSILGTGFIFERALCYGKDKMYTASNTGLIKN